MIKLHKFSVVRTVNLEIRRLVLQDVDYLLRTWKHVSMLIYIPRLSWCETLWVLCVSVSLAQSTLLCQCLWAPQDTPGITGQWSFVATQILKVGRIPSQKTLPTRAGQCEPRSHHVTPLGSLGLMGEVLHLWSGLVTLLAIEELWWVLFLLVFKPLLVFYVNVMTPSIRCQ